MSEKISLAGLNKGAVLAALYNASRPLGMGFLHYNPVPMTVEEAQELLDQGRTYFDYLKGRVMKVDLGEDELDPWGYDRDNGVGAAAKAIAILRQDGPEAQAILETHQRGKELAAADAREAMNIPSQSHIVDNTIILDLSLQDVAEQLGPAVDRAVKPT